MVTKDVDLPASATAVSAFQMSLTRNTPPEPISPLVAAGKAPAEARSGRIDRTAAPATRTVDVTVDTTPEPTTAKTVPVDLPEPTKSQPVAKAEPAAVDNVPENQAAALSGWFVQAGSFANRDNAERLTRRLKDKDFSAFMLRASSGGRTVYRVRIGPLGARRDAEKLAPVVAAASGGPTEVVSNP
jgi:cell division protein FtsN